MENNLVSKNGKSTDSKFAKFLGHALVGCIFGCLCAIAIALTIRFITWIF